MSTTLEIYTMPIPAQLRERARKAPRLNPQLREMTYGVNPRSSGGREIPVAMPTSQDRSFSAGKHDGRNFSDSFQDWPSLSGLRSNPYSCQSAFKEIGETLQVRLSMEFALHLSSSQGVHERVALYPGRTA